MSEHYASCAKARHFSPHYTARVDGWRGEASERHRSAPHTGTAGQRALPVQHVRTATMKRLSAGGTWRNGDGRIHSPPQKDLGGGCGGLYRSRGMRRIFTKSDSAALQVAFLCLFFLSCMIVNAL